MSRIALKIFSANCMETGYIQCTKNERYPKENEKSNNNTKENCSRQSSKYWVVKNSLAINLYCIILA